MHSRPSWVAPFWIKGYGLWNWDFLGVCPCLWQIKSTNYLFHNQFLVIDANEIFFLSLVLSLRFASLWHPKWSHIWPWLLRIG